MEALALYNTKTLNKLCFYYGIILACSLYKLLSLFVHAIYWLRGLWYPLEEECASLCVRHLSLQAPFFTKYYIVHNVKQYTDKRKKKKRGPSRVKRRIYSQIRLLILSGERLKLSLLMFLTDLCCSVRRNVCQRLLFGAFLLRIHLISCHGVVYGQEKQKLVLILMKHVFSKAHWWQYLLSPLAKMEQKLSFW